MIDIRTGKPMTRRDALAGGIAAIIASGCAPSLVGSANATVVGMMRNVGARMAMIGGVGDLTAKNYIQNGIVAIFDGIENVGWGVHDASVATWKDLVGSSEGMLVGNCSFSDKYCQIYGKSGALVRLDGFSVPSGGNTIEIVFGFSEIKLSYNRILSNGNYRFYPRSDIGVQGSGTYAPNLNAYGVDTYSYSTRFSRDLTPDYTPHCISMSIDFTDLECNWMIDGVQYSNTPVSINYFSTTYDGFAFGNDPNASRGQDCRIYSMRCYNRAISPAEASANYAIDKARFDMT